MVIWNKDNHQLIIEQSTYSRWLYTLLGIIGIVLFPIGSIGMIAVLTETGRETVLQIFSSNLLIFHFLTTLSIMLMYIRFSSQSNKNYREKIVFDNATEAMSLSTFKQVAPYTIPYADISRIHTLKEEGGPDYPDMHLIHLIKKDGAEFWITGFASKQKEFYELVNVIAEHTGFEVRDGSNLGTAHSRTKTYQPKERAVDYITSRFVKQLATKDGDVITIKPATKSFSVYCIGLLGYSLFLSVPLYIIQNFIMATTPLLIRIAAIVFIGLWYAILLMTFILSMKDYTITVNAMGITIKLQCRVLAFIKSTIHIPGNNVLHVRTNRLDGGHFSLSLGISNDEKSIKTGTMAFMNIGTYTKGNIKSRFVKTEKLISLWVIPAGIKPGCGPVVTDLLFIEKYIQNRLGLMEKDI